MFRTANTTGGGRRRGRLGRALVPAASLWALAVPALLTTATSTAGAAAQGHPSALSIAMTLGTATRPTWWAPISSSQDCWTVTGGMGEGLNYYMPLLWLSSKDTIDLQI